MEQAAKMAPNNSEVLYDLAVIRLATNDIKGALEAITKAIKLNPNLKKQALEDNDLAVLRKNKEFKKILEQ